MSLSACLTNLQMLVSGCNVELDWMTERLNQMLVCIRSLLISAHREQNLTHVSDF